MRVKLSQPKLTMIECVNNYVHVHMVHGYILCVRMYVYSVQAKRAGQLRTARWAPYS